MESKRTNIENTKQVVQNSSSRRLSSIIGNRAYSDLYLPPIIQREKPVKPVGKCQINYYIQTEEGSKGLCRKRKKGDNKTDKKTDKVENGKICKVNEKTYKVYEKLEGKNARKSDEPGYLRFRSTKKASNYSKIFLKQTKEEYKDVKEWIYTKKNINITLPVSCIEATTWAMKIMGSKKVEQYPEYMAFPSEFYDAMDAVETEADRPVSKMNEDEAADLLSKVGTKLKKDKCKYLLKQFKKRSTGVKIDQTRFYIDRDIISNKFVKDTEEYTGKYKVGDGILIATPSNEKDDDAPEFHAVAIVAVFDEDGFIVLERNAGSTEIESGHLGDEHWVFNYYESACEFKKNTQNNFGNYKAFHLTL